MAVAPVKNVPKRVTQPTNPGWGNAATIAKKFPSAMPYSPGGGTNLGAYTAATSGYQQANFGIAPAVTTPAPSGGGGGASSTPGHWNIPDYKALLAGDWEPEEAAIAGQKQEGEYAADFQLALRRAFIDYGGDVNKLDDKFKQYIDEPTIEAARNNKFSTMAQNLKAQTKSLANQRAQLAARGMTRSGANAGLTRRALEARELADYSAGRTFLGGAEEGLSGLAKARMEIANAISAAKARAAARIAEENPQTWVPGTGEGYEGAAAYGGEPAPAAAAPWGGVTWGGTPGIKTKAALQAKLGYNQTLAQWARDHPAAWAKLT